MTYAKTAKLTKGMLDCTIKIERYVNGLSFEQFQASHMVVDAVIWNLEIIGEAAKYIPHDLWSKYAAIDWKRLVGFRKTAIHAYFAVDESIVWVTVTQRLPQLKEVLVQMLEDSQSP